MYTINFIEEFAHISFFILILSYNFAKHSLIGQLGMVIFAISAFLLCISKKSVKISYFFTFMLFFILYNYYNIIQGNVISYETAFSMVRSLFISIIMLFFVYNYLILSSNKRKPLDYFVNATLVTTLIVCILNIKVLFTERLGISSSFGANHISLIVAIAMYIILHNYLIDRKKGNIIKLLWLAFIIFLTGSRKGIFMVAFGFTFLIYTLYPKKRLRNILIGTLLTSVMFLLIMNIPILYNIIGSRVEELLKYLNIKETSEYSLRDRLFFIDIGWKYFLERPWTGYGLDCFKMLPESKGRYSHNNFIELLFSGGIIAFSIYYICYIISIFKCRLAYKSNNSIVGLMFTIIISMLLIDYGYVAYYDRIRLIVWVMVVAYTEIASKSADTDSYGGRLWLK